ncbi:MAG TPA: DNA/RNA non-specific endonuclease [Chitinophagaceae bacterium]|nr:DNA/RNA non-specific endonuclease [Chitinophagaceae bacterium]
MINKEKIANANYQLADEAAKKLKIYQHRDDIGKKAEEIERMKANALRESKRSEVEKIAAATERIVRGKDESRERPPSLKVEALGSAVARLHERSVQQEPKGFGTGFLIAPNILITNHHVFESDAEALGCVANFKFQRNFLTGEVSEGSLFNLRPDIFFYNNPTLDFALVYVEDDSLNSTDKLTSLGLLPLIGTKGKVKNGDHINIIQYPQGGVKKYTTEDNEVFDIDDESGIVYYYTDTEPGSSGSPGFNDYWEVAALHYTGVPNTNEQGQWLTKDKKVWDKNTMSDKDVDWIANAGKSVSKIVSFLKDVNLPSDKQKYIESILNNSKDPLANAGEAAKSQEPQLQPLNDTNMNKYNFTFNGNVNLNINEGIPTPAKVHSNGNGANVIEGIAMVPKGLEKKERFDEDYSDREGYQEEFIPNFKVPMPTVAAARDRELYRKFEQANPFIVPYYHYSLVMNKKRRMAMWTASNVDYNSKFRDKRDRNELGNGAWRLDKRVPAKYQIQAEEFYDPATLVDKGHLVRRDDNCWMPLKNGRTDSLGIEYANADTFHWTNCTPQHEAFNRDMFEYTNVGKWGVLENAIKSQLDKSNDPQKDFGQRACVLAGPVLADDDPEYMDIQYPLRFWKVFAINSDSDGKLVYGFLLSQADKIREAGLEARPRFPRMVKAMQVSLKVIEDLTGVVFAAELHAVDVKRGNDVVPTESLSDDLSNLETRKRTLSYDRK